MPDSGINGSKRKDTAPVLETRDQDRKPNNNNSAELIQKFREGFSKEVNYKLKCVDLSQPGEGRFGNTACYRGEQVKGPRGEGENGTYV